VDRREAEYVRCLLTAPPLRGRRALDRERALGLLEELVEPQDRLEALVRRLEDPAEEGSWRPGSSTA
jgi:hypothetical protein